MSLVSPYRPVYEVNDFYESLQNIQDNFEVSENFGRQIADYAQFKNVKKVCSYNNLTANLSFDEGARKSFSTTSFTQNELELQNYYGKSPFGYQLDDQSTMTSFSSMSSVNSHSPALSTPNMLASANNNTSNNNNKGKSKGNGGKKKKTGDVDYRKKYKTEVCKNWTEKGFCDFGDQCAFAHGNEEIRQKCHISSNYKTKKCIQFHETGYCPYGGRCQFIHSLRKERQLDCKGETVPYLEAMENPEIYITHDPDCVCMQKKTRRRLPSFQLVSDDNNSSNNES